MQIKRRLKQAVILGTFVALGGVVLGAGANLYMLRASAPHIAEFQRSIRPAYVAIVLGARVYKNERPSNSLRERLEVAQWLYEQGKVKRILVTGDNGQASYNEVRVMFQWLVDRGVPAEHVFLDHAGFRTYDSMQRAARVFQVEDAIVCTQGFHMARSVYHARVAGIDAQGMNTSGQGYRVKRRDQMREFIARTVAILDAHVWPRDPKFLGPTHPITGSASSTHPKGFTARSSASAQ